MTPWLLVALPAVASAIGLPISDAASVLGAVHSNVLDIARVAYVTCFLLGVILYFTHLGRRTGKDLMVGGMLLVVFTEYLIPTVTALR
jgi:uncharacterized membrane protein